MTRRTLIVTLGLSASLVSTLAHAGGGPLFDLQADALDPQACGGTGCWTNHMRLTDLDGDGSLDILLVNYADFFDGANAAEPLVLYANDGDGNFTNRSTEALGNYVGNLRQAAVGDVDGDGSPDIYAPDATGGLPVLFMNDGSGVFTDEAEVRLPASMPRGAAARMGDVDNDGDLDIFSADGYAVNGPPFGHIYINDGLGVFEELEGAIPESIMGVDIDDCEFADVDGDFDLDLVVNAHAGGTGAVWLNDGGGTFSAETTIDPPATGNFHYNVTPCDVDGDGDLDLWIENIGGGFTEQLLINDGDGNFADETAERVTGNPGADDNGVICVDIDDDGDFDAVVVSLGTAERLLVNDGDGNFAFSSGAFPGPVDGTLWGEFGDVDGDGRIDLVTAQGEVSSSDEVYFANAGLAIDSTAPVFRGIATIDGVEADAPATIRFAVSDRTVTDEGPRLARAWAVLDPDGDATEIEAGYMGGDLFRAVFPGQPEGVVTYTVCAEDPVGNAICSEPQTYDVGPQTGTSSGSGGESSGTTDGPDPDSSGPDTGTPTVTDPSVTDPTVTDTATDSDSESTGTSPGQDDDGGCSCTTTPVRPAALAWPVLAGLVFRRRRRSAGA